jgi:hypothetical protein
MRPDDATIGSVTTAVAQIRVCAEVETLTQSKPIAAVSAAVELAEQVILEGGRNTPEPLLGAQLLELAMEMERESGESWGIESYDHIKWASNRAANSRGGRGVARPPWLRDCIGYLPAAHCICTRSSGRCLSSSLADQQLSPQASKAAKQGGPFHAVALSLWEHGHHDRAESLWREQVVRRRR